MYATALDMLNLYADREMAQLAAPESPAVDGVLLRLTVEGGDRSAYSAQDQADADKALLRIDEALADAERFINSYLSPNYTLPLAVELIADSNLKRVTCDITRYEMDTRPREDMRDRYSDHKSWLRDVAMNKASLGEQDTATAAQDGRMVIRPGVSKTDWDTF